MTLLVRVIRTPHNSELLALFPVITSSTRLEGRGSGILFCFARLLGEILRDCWTPRDEMAHGDAGILLLRPRNPFLRQEETWSPQKTSAPKDRAAILRA